MGSKNRIARHIVPIMVKEKGNRTWVEPFVGGANVIDKVPGKRIGADVNRYLIEALRLIRDTPDLIPDLITEEDYDKARYGKIEDEGLTGYIGFTMSFGGKWFGGYRRDVAGTKGSMSNMINQSRRSKDSALRQSPNLQDVVFQCIDYQHLEIPPNSLIYCDPPYEGTTKYKNDFNHEQFWNWCRRKAKEGHIVFVSEYNAPDDFECVWSKEVTTSLSTSDSKKAVEKLFKIKT
jgi:DNA adenine methylase